MCDDFRIRLGFEGMTLGAQFLAQRPEILDDAVMDDGDLAVAMRVGIFRRRFAMRRPASMANAGMAAQRLFGEQRFKVF